MRETHVKQGEFLSFPFISFSESSLLNRLRRKSARGRGRGPIFTFPVSRLPVSGFVVSGRLRFAVRSSRAANVTTEPPLESSSRARRRDPEEGLRRDSGSPRPPGLELGASR